MAGKKDKQMIPNLREKYTGEVVSGMMDRFHYNNVMEVPKISHVSVNMGIGDAKDNPKKLESALQELTLISGQKPVITRSRKDISNFKIRQGFPVGCKIIFTEIDYDKIDSIRGMDITFSTTAKTNDESYWLLKLIGLPLRDKPIKQEVVEAA